MPTKDNKKRPAEGKKTTPKRKAKTLKKKAARGKATAPKAPANAAKPAPVKAARPPGFPIVGLGASAGGLEASEAFFKAMPANSGMAFVLVVHLDPTHVSILPDLIQKHTKMVVTQVAEGARVKPNCVYVIPPNKDLAILNGVLQLMEQSKPRGANLPIDTFLRSLAQDQGPNAVCVILSGTGSDGTLGLRAVKGEAGMVMAQDPESAKYDGMPRSAISTGLADFVLPPEQMPEQLIAYAEHAAQRDAPKIEIAGGKLPDSIQKVFILLRTQTGHDFSLYKRNTIFRRIERRMHVHQIDGLSDYVRYLQKSEREVAILFKELLIGVTSFFRDPDAFDALRDKALPKLLEGKPDDYTVRVWVPGCSTGEEAYSAGIVLLECMDAIKRHFSVQIFGTDLDQDAIDVARGGVYPGSIAADVGPERLKRHFVEEDDQYRIKKQIRQMVVFAPQNVIKDPPFTKLDLLCCRNLLIYLGTELQHKMLPLFHYSLKPNGLLFLGSSETIGQATDLFGTVDKKWRIFKRKPSATAGPRALDFPAAPVPVDMEEDEAPDAIKAAEELSALQLVETVLRQSGAPPCAVVDDARNIVYIHGRTGKFLEPAAGKASVNIVDMARPGLKAELASALREVSLSKQELAHKGLRIEENGGHIFIDLTVKPILEHVGVPGLMMVTFQERSAPAKAAEAKPKRVTTRRKSKDAERLERELQYTRESLQTTIEELETSNEELKSTNEELQSTNEELQSTNEELETSKEELQSMNEEAATVNAELQSRIDDLSKANDDMKNLLDSTHIATLFLDTELCVCLFTPKATDIIPLAGTDTGRSITHFATNLVDVNLAEHAEQVLNNLAIREAEVASKDGRYFQMRAMPYRTVANVIDGVVVTFEDVTERRRLLAESEKAKLLAESIVDTIRDPLLVLDGELRIVSASKAFYRTFQTDADATVGSALYELGNGQWRIPKLQELLEAVLPANSTVEDYVVEHEFPTIGRRKMVLNARQLVPGDGDATMILLAIEDVTDHR